MRSVTLSENFSQTIQQQITKPSSTTTGLMSVAAAAAGMQVWDSGPGILIKYDMLTTPKSLAHQASMQATKITPSSEQYHVLHTCIYI